MEKSARPAQLDATVRELTRELLELSVTPHVRELRAKAVTYGRVIANWAVYTPTPPQVQAMVECIDELQAKVADAKRDAGSSDVSRVTRRRGTSIEPGRPSGSLLPSAIPPALGWNGAPDTTGIRARSSRPVPSRHVSSDAPTRPPPAGSGAPPAGEGAPPVGSAAPQPTTAPPVSAPRARDDHPTPIPALLRSRRSH